MKLSKSLAEFSQKITLAFLLIFWCGAIVCLAQSGIDPTFNATELYYNTVGKSVTVQPDGKILVGGSFGVVIGVEKKAIVRLNADGSLDTSFNANGSGIYGNNNGSYPAQVLGEVRVIKVLTDGKIIVAGSFYTYNGIPSGGLARLNSDGSLDTSFMNFNAFGGGGDIYNLEIQTDGKILVGGYGSIVRLNADGSRDSTFSYNFFSLRISFTLLADGKIAVSGENGAHFQFLRRFNSDGSPDIVYPLNDTATALRGLPDGKLLVGGVSVYRFNADGSKDSTFSQIQNTGRLISKVELTTENKVLVSFYNGSSNLKSIVRLLADGKIDMTFNAASNFAGVYNFAVQADGKIVVVGVAPTLPLPAVPRSIVRLEATGAIDNSFDVVLAYYFGVVNNVSKIVVQPDGKILALGDYRAADGEMRRGIVRLNSDGSRNISFTALEPNNIYDFAVQSDGKIVVVGRTARPANEIFLVRLNADGSPDNTLASPSTPYQGDIRSIALQPNGKILLVGFVASTGSSNGNVIRLNSNGSLDSTFNSAGFQTGSEFFAKKALVQPDGKILVTGSFSERIVRLNADGGRDTTFNSDFSNKFIGAILDVELQPDGKILVGGGGGNSRLLRLNPNGSLDAGFNPNVEDTVTSIKLQSDNKILIGGLFTQVNGATRLYLARINADGSLDNFNPSTSYQSKINDIETQPDGKILLGGGFIEINNTLRFGVVRLLSAAQTTPFDFDGDGKADISVFRNGIWHLQRSQKNFTAVYWGIASDKIAPADFDGDGITDTAVYRASNGEWSVLRSSTNTAMILKFGAPEDLPRPADFDGDGKADIAVWRPSNGYWYWLRSSDGHFAATQFGALGDIPLIADFDGDGKADIAVWRPSNGVWYWLRSSDGRFAATQFGATEDKPVAADFDGDGKTDLAVFRPSNHYWYQLRSSDNRFTATQFGASGDVPTAGDYDGDGKADIAVFRPSNGVWYLQRTTQGFTGVQFGISSDKPIPNAFIP